MTQTNLNNLYLMFNNFPFEILLWNIRTRPTFSNGFQYFIQTELETIF